MAERGSGPSLKVSHAYTLKWSSYKEKGMKELAARKKRESKFSAITKLRKGLGVEIQLLKK